MDASLQAGVVMTVPGDEIAAKAGAPAHGKARIPRLAAVLMAETVLYAATWVLALSRQTNMEGNPVNWDHKLALLSTFVYLLVRGQHSDVDDKSSTAERCGGQRSLLIAIPVGRGNQSGDQPS